MVRPTTLTNAIRRNVIIEQDVWRAISARAAAEDRSASDVIREALRQYLGLK